MVPTRTGSPASQDPNQFPAEVQSVNRWLSFGVCLFLALTVWAVFGRTLRYEFVNCDDPVYIYENPAITHGFSLSGVVWLFTHDDGPDEWLPLTALSRMLDWQFYGPNAGGHHLTNVALHAAAAILLFLVLRKMTGAFWRSAFVAAVFAIHPMRVESVAWVTERKDVLSGLFFMLTLWAYVRHAQRQSRVERRASNAGSSSLALGPRLWTLDYGLALLFFILGLLSKTMLVTLPFVLLLLDYWPLRRMGGDAQSSGLDARCSGRLCLEKVPFLLLSAAACVATALTQQQAALALRGVTFPWRAGNALVSYVAYLWQMVYPAGLAVFYPHPGNHLPVWKVGLSALVLLLISAAVMAGRRKHPYLPVGWLWYLGMLVPVIGLVQVGEQARADRYTYLPQIGLYILLTWGAVELCGSWRYRRAALGFAAGAILGGLLAGAYVQTGYWKDSLSLWMHALAGTPENSVAHLNLGNALARQGKFAEAIPHFERALQLKPDYAEASLNLGNALIAEGKLAEAVQRYEQALQLKPDYSEAHVNLGVALAAQGKLAEAVQHYERALQLKPDAAEAHCHLGIALVRQGRLDEALQHCQRALQLAPDYAEAHIGLGNVLAMQGNMTEAIPHYERALQLKPDAVEVHCNLGVALASQGKLTEARQHFERALQLKPDYAEAQYNLGLALAAEGKAAEARQHLEDGLKLATAQGDAALAESIRARLKSYPPALPPPQTP